MRREIGNWWNRLSLRYKISSMFVLVTVVIMLINLYMFSVMNRMTAEVEAVYTGNVSLNELAQSLGNVQDSMEEYLNTKSTDAMDEYYRSEQDYRTRLEDLNGAATDSPILLMEKNIKGLSENYLAITEEAVQAKRGRNVERYGQLYEEAERSYEAIREFIYSLNNEQFRTNSVVYQQLMVQLRYTEIVSVAVLILVLIANASLIVFSIGMITEPLQRLARAANEVAGGRLDLEEIPVQSRDEVGVVTGAFNQMIHSIRDYIEQVRLTAERENAMRERELRMQSSLKEAQLNYLQAQINPHFLFNTLNAGAQLAMMEDAPRTERFLGNVAEFFRYNVRRNEQDATLQEEIRLVDNYIYIMNVRFAGEIRYTEEIDESLLGIRVPSMLLQPLVENAINHGIRNLDRQGRIELSVYREDGKACISVWDNGAGMTAERIQEVLYGEDASDANEQDSNGVGVRNVRRRLQLFCHGDADLQIVSEGEDQGTEILITIPMSDEEFAADMQEEPASVAGEAPGVTREETNVSNHAG